MQAIQKRMMQYEDEDNSSEKDSDAENITDEGPVLTLIGCKE